MPANIRKEAYKMTFDEAKQFITVWQASNSVEEVAKKLKMDEVKVQGRVRALRKKGIALKAYGHSTAKMSETQLSELKALAQSNKTV
jgi:transposase